MPSEEKKYEVKPNSIALWNEWKKGISKAGREYEMATGKGMMECPHCKQQTQIYATAFKNVTKSGKELLNIGWREESSDKSFLEKSLSAISKRDAAPGYLPPTDKAPF